jgi:hypothetical protein
MPTIKSTIKLIESVVGTGKEAAKQLEKEFYTNDETKDKPKR